MTTAILPTPFALSRSFAGLLLLLGLLGADLTAAGSPLDRYQFRLTWCHNNETVCSGCPTCPRSPWSVDRCGEHPTGQYERCSENSTLEWQLPIPDYLATGLPGGGAGCAPCEGGGAGGGAGGNPAPEGGRLPDLQLWRIYRPWYQGGEFRQSFGPGMYSNFDLSLLCYGNWSGQPRIRVSEPNTSAKWFFTNDTDADGIWTMYDREQFVDIRTYDASSALEPDFTAAATAELTTHDGWTFTFDLIRVDSDPNSIDRAGRLTGIADRNGNGITLVYDFARDASDATLGGDRTQLWKIATITDAYGRVASIDYATTTVGGHHVISSIGLPNGETISYTYDSYAQPLGSATEGLVQVDFPDSTTATIGTSYDSGSQCTKLAYFEPAAPADIRRQTVYLSGSTWVDPVTSTSYGQAANRVRRIDNGEDEIVYLNWFESVGGNEWTHVYTGGNRLLRSRIAGGLVRETERAIDFTAADLNSDTSTFTWEDVVDNATKDSGQRPVTETDALNRQVSRTLADNGNPLSTSRPDGSGITATYNGFAQPLSVTDRIGRVTKRVYDSAGNLTSLTRGFGTTEASEETYDYTANGQLATVYDPLYVSGTPALHATAYTYDSNGYLTTITHPADTASGTRPETSFTYETGSGFLATRTDPLDREVTFAYDERGRVTTITYADDSTETFTYGTGDDEGLLVSETDRNGNTTIYSYDLAGRLTGTTWADGTSAEIEESCSYLTGTGLETDCIRRGERTVTSYDFDNRVATVTRYPDQATALITTTAYDQLGRRFRVEDAYGRATYYLYDINDRITRIVRETVPGALDTAISAPTRDQSVTGSASASGTSTTWTDQRDLDLAGLGRVLTANAGYLIEDIDHDAEGQLVSRTDGRGNVTTMTYDALGRRIRVVEADNVAAIEGTTEWDYDDAGNVTAIRSPRHFVESGDFVTVMTYTGRNLLASRTEAYNRTEAATESFSYYLDGRLATRTDFEGAVWTTTWGACCGRVQGQGDPSVTLPGAGSATQPGRVIRHDDYGNVAHVGVLTDITAGTFPTLSATTNQSDFTDSATLNETTVRYDGLHRPTYRTQWLVKQGTVSANQPPIAGLDSVPATDGLTTSFVYDEDLTDGVGLDSTYATQLAELGVGFFGTNADGYAIATTNPEGETSVVVQDGLGRTVMTIDGQGDAVLMQYDSVITPAAGTGSPGDLVATTTVRDPGGLDLTTTRHQDGAGRALELIDALGKRTSIGYDANGNRISLRDPNGVGEDCTYDARNRETICKDTEEDATFTFYDANGNVVQTIDAEGVVDLGGIGMYPSSSQSPFSDPDGSEPTAGATTCTFDPRDRKVACDDRIDAVTEYTYDDNSNLIQITDAEGGSTQYDYDVRNLLIAERFPGHHATTNYDQRLYDYDGARRLVSRDDQQRDVTSYAYDLANRLETRVYPDGLDDSFTYDAASRLLTAESERYDVGCERVYFDDGTLRYERLTIDGITYEIEHGYDAANRATSCEYPDGTILASDFTDRDQLWKRTFDGTLLATLAYDDGMRETTRSFGNAKVQTRTYGRDDNLVTDIVVPGVTDFDYTYDANKRKLTEGDASVLDWDQTFGYDDEDRLIAWDRAGTTTSPIPEDRDWTLTAVGDWADVTTDTVFEDRDHNEVHELTQRTIGATQLDLAYDAKGNLIDDADGRRYGWDPENRLQTADIHAAASGVDLWSDLVAHWRLDLADGTTTPDATGNGHDGTLTGGSTIAPSAGRLIGCAVHDGSDDRIVVADDADLRLQTYTLSGWFKLTDITITRVITSKMQSSTNRTWRVAVNHGSHSHAGSLNWSVSSGGVEEVELYSPGTVNDGEWHHFAAVLDGTTSAKLYLDGQLVASMTTPGAADLPTQPVIIGAQDSSGDRSFPGSIDDLRLYARAFSASEVTALYGLEQARYAYDALGRRVRKHVSESNVVTSYVLAGAQVLTEYEATGAGSPVLERQYVYAGYVDDPIAMLTPDGSGGFDATYYHSNHLFSVAALTDDSGTVLERYGYDAYGESEVLNAAGSAVLSGSTVGNAYRYTGRRLDGETGLSYFRARYMDHELGRFVGRDPLQYVDGYCLYGAYFVPNLLDSTGGNCHGARNRNECFDSLYDLCNAQRGNGVRPGWTAKDCQEMATEQCQDCPWEWEIPDWNNDDPEASWEPPELPPEGGYGDENKPYGSVTHEPSEGGGRRKCYLVILMAGGTTDECLKLTNLQNINLCPLLTGWTQFRPFRSCKSKCESIVGQMEKACRRKSRGTKWVEMTFTCCDCKYGNP